MKLKLLALFLVGCSVEIAQPEKPQNVVGQEVQYGGGGYSSVSGCDKENDTITLTYEDGGTKTYSVPILCNREKYIFKGDPPHPDVKLPKTGKKIENENF